MPTAVGTPTTTVAISSTPTPMSGSTGVTTSVSATASLTIGTLGPAAPVAALPISAHALYFTDTGHNVAGAFLGVFNQGGGLAAFGYPRTESFRENGLLVQFFQNAELQCAALCREPAYTATVTLSPLGDILAGTPSPYPQAQRQVSWGDSMYFASTSHNLDGPFLDYWRTHDGAFMFGAPISEALSEATATGQGYTLQYFDRGALALRPVGPNHSFVVVPEPLGDEVLRQRGLLP